MIQTYDISKTYQENYDAGPQFADEPPPIPATASTDFLGLEVNSRLGIAAGLLLNSKWILGYAKRGFDLLTYKTVRSSYRPCYPLPNWVFVDAIDEPDCPVYVTDELPEDPRAISSSVCFGMPSMAPEVWREDVAVAKAGLAEGQRLIVSVVATPQDGWGPQEVADDFALCARWAAEAGADVIEANYSCPNVCTAEGSIYLDPEFSQLITRTIREAIGGTPLLLKVGYFGDLEVQENFLRRVGEQADGVTMVNGISRPVLNRDGSPAYGPGYVRAGVLGRVIHEPSVRSVRTAVDFIRREGFNLSIAAVGGASQPEDIQDFLDAGASAVLMGSSPMYLPNLAIEAKRSL